MDKNLQKFGQLLKDLRIKMKLSLRDVCKETGYDPSNWSKIERGLISTPAEEKTLIKWARILGLSQNKKKVREFVDEAQMAQGIIPKDILSQPNAVRCLPAFFRTMRNEKPNKEEIDRLVDLIRKS
jgi:transcriptional regulator with XRE-family HTH domain